MKLIFNKITATLLAFMVLFSTFSFTVEKHYCGEFLVDISYFGETDGCGMKMDKQSSKKSCCKDEVKQVKGQDKLQKEISKTLNFKQQKLIVAHLYSFINLYKEAQLNKEYYKDFSPPDIEKDILILHETFLI